MNYAKHHVTDADIAAVVEVLKSDHLTQGPKVEEFEEAFADKVGKKYAVAFNSGTSALMGAFSASPERAFWMSPLTFVATPNAVIASRKAYNFVDINPNTYLMDWSHGGSNRVNMDYAGHPSDRQCEILDACHSLGATMDGKPSCHNADTACYSFHPAKHITCGEGGMAVTDCEQTACMMRLTRDNGRGCDGDVTEVGYNFRMSDINAALGLSQLSRLDENVARRREIAKEYNKRLCNVAGVVIPVEAPNVKHSYHLYAVRILGGMRDKVKQDLSDKGINTQIHYKPAHLYSLYGGKRGDFPNAERAWDELLSLPMYPRLEEDQIESVCNAVEEAMNEGTN